MEQCLQLGAHRRSIRFSICNLKSLTHPLCTARLCYCYYPGYLGTDTRVPRSASRKTFIMEVMDVSESERDINITGNDLSGEEEVVLNAYGSPVRVNRTREGSEPAIATAVAGQSTSDNIDRVVRSFASHLCV